MEDPTCVPSGMGSECSRPSCGRSPGTPVHQGPVPHGAIGQAPSLRLRQVWITPNQDCPLTLILRPAHLAQSAILDGSSWEARQRLPATPPNPAGANDQPTWPENPSP